MPGPFTYYDTPKADQKINATQPLIRTNFSSISDEFSINHVGLGGASADAGMHNLITMPVNTTPTGVASYANIYYKQPSSVAGEAATLATKEVCIMNETGKGIPITASLANENGWAFLPGGILFKWGTRALGSTPGSTITITYPVGAGTIPAFTAVYNVQVSVFNPAANTPSLRNAEVVLARPAALTTTTFQVSLSRMDGSATLQDTSIYWFATGKGY